MFWRESDYERFVKRLRLFELHESTSQAAWDSYEAFGRARVRVQTRRNISLTIDHINAFYEFIRIESAHARSTLFDDEGEQGEYWVEAAKSEQYFEQQLEDFLKRERLV